jgi:hypothetical protein
MYWWPGKSKRYWNLSIQPAKMAIDVTVVGHVDEVLEFVSAQA